MEKYINIPGIYNNSINCQPLNYLGHEKIAEDKSTKLDPKVVDLVKKITPNPDRFIYILLTALGAGNVWGPNSNADFFFEKDLNSSDPSFGHLTFLDAGIFTHHKNKDKSKTLGEVLLSIYNPKMKRVELVERVDRDKAKEHGASDIYDRLNDGEHLDVSMGCRVKYDVCMICGNKAPTRKEYCDEMKLSPGKILPDGRIVCVYNPRPVFFDISFVNVGAAKNAKVMDKLAQREDGRICLGDVCTVPSIKIASSSVVSDADIGAKRRREGETYEDQLINDIVRDYVIQKRVEKQLQGEPSMEGIRSHMRSAPVYEEDVGPMFSLKTPKFDKLAAIISDKFDRFAKEYTNHAALNLSQAVKDLSLIKDHPDADKVAPIGTKKHLASSVALRAPEIASDIYYGIIPPHLTHSKEEVEELGKSSVKDMLRKGMETTDFEKARIDKLKGLKQNIHLDPMETELYKKAARKTINFQGLPIKIEVEKGDIRKKKTWSTKMKCAYGHIPKTSGEDGEEIDVYLNDNPNGSRVFIIRQLKEDKSYDEDKIMLGFKTKEEAKEMYLAHIPAKFFGAIIETDMKSFLEKYLPEFKKTAGADNCDCGCNSNCVASKADEVMNQLLSKLSSTKNASQNKQSEIIKKVPALIEPISRSTDKVDLLKINREKSQNSSKIENRN